MGNTAPQEIPKASPNNSNVKSPPQEKYGYDYTFSAKRSNKTEKEDTHTSAEEGKKIVMNFEDPYMNLNTPSATQDRQVENIFNKLDRFLNANLSNQESMRSLETYNPLLSQKSGPKKQFKSFSTQDLHTDINKEVWQKSYELLEKLKSERNSKLGHYSRLENISQNEQFPHNILSEVSNYKQSDEYSRRSRSRHADRSSENQSKSGDRATTEYYQKRTRNNTGRSHTQFMPQVATDRVEFVLYNKDMINAMLKMIKPTTSKNSCRL